MVKVDLIIRKDSTYQKQAFGRRKFFDIGGLTVPVIAPEDMILSKLDWARDSKSKIQLRDVKNIAESFLNLDLHYLEMWTAKLELSALYKKALR